MSYNMPNTVFKNSCLKVPVNPSNRLPSAMYERSSRNSRAERERTELIRAKLDRVELEQSKLNRSELERATVDPLCFRDFYRSIPDYEDVNHLSRQDFDLKLKMLKEDKRKLLMTCGSKNDNKDCEFDDHIIKRDNDVQSRMTTPKERKAEYNSCLRERELSNRSKETGVSNRREESISDIDSIFSLDNAMKNRLKASPIDNKYLKVQKKDSEKVRGKRNNSACSISWNDELVASSSPRKLASDGSRSCRDDSDLQLLMADHGRSPANLRDDLKKSYSVPTSPVKKSPKDLGLTVPKPFKMTERDDENKILSQLHEYSLELEHQLLRPGTSGGQSKQFKAKPVPVESRIPLYDRLVEDMELRRSINKLQSRAELQAQMRPFRFSGLGSRRRLCCSTPHLAPSPATVMTSPQRTFRAKPVPKNLFSNYVYDKMREDDYYRALSRRIRAEEMLKGASLPPSMARREKYHGECSEFPGYFDCKDRTSSGSRARGKSRPVRSHAEDEEGELEKELKELKKDFAKATGRRYHTRLSSGKKESIHKVYGAGSSESSRERPCSAVEARSVNRSNLAAVLRIEATKRKLEQTVLKRLEEERLQSEMRWRDSVLRRRPAWNTLKLNSHAGDLAMRLQTRRDEERLRREQFTHDMELMYGRVHRQPLMFERDWAPRTPLSRRAARSVAIREAAAKEEGRAQEYDDDEDKDSEVAEESIEEDLKM